MSPLVALLASMLCMVGFCSWYKLMRMLGAFKTEKEVLAGLYYECPCCYTRMYWDKEQPMPNRTCPHCGMPF